jgi:hypothetical protein
MSSGAAWSATTTATSSRKPVDLEEELDVPDFLK